MLRSLRDRAGLAAGVLALAVTLSAGSPVQAQEHLSAGETVAIGAGSITVAACGLLAKKVDSARTPLFSGPILFDRGLQRLLGGSGRGERANFLDSRAGGALTPILGTALLFAANLTWPETRPWPDAGEDLFLCAAGLAANRGLNDLVKGLVARPRPYTRRARPADRMGPRGEFAYAHHSFYSGHTSAAFFTAAFVNRRLRSIMRQRLTANEYGDWRWAPPALLYGWAGFVGLSRIHADKHYATDVLAGALTGFLVGELYHSFRPAGKETAAAPPLAVRVTLCF